jgi:hypothetical protein
MSYQAIQTDDGIVIEDETGEQIAGASNSDPIRGQTLDTLLTDAGFTEDQKEAIRIALGDIDYL